MHIISHMAMIIPSFQYEPLILTPKPKTLDKEKERGNTDGVGPLGTRTKKEELTNLRRGKDSPHKEVDSMIYALE